jgi:hypothetical protein
VEGEEGEEKGAQKMRENGILPLKFVRKAGRGRPLLIQYNAVHGEIWRKINI